MSDRANVSVRVRGIYTTSVTRLLLESGYDVVQASAPIERRFDAEFGSGDHDVAVETTSDRQGVGVEGDPDAVAAIRELLADLAVDVLHWKDPAPRGAIFDGVVAETFGNGAVVDLGETEGYLPYSNVDHRVESGDHLRVQVEETAPPWSDDRPTLSADFRAEGGLATLAEGSGIRVEGRDDAEARELAGMTDLLGADPPEGWAIRWSRDAVDADMTTLDASLSRAAERAEEMDAALDEAGDVDPIRRPFAPEKTVWVWFGREARFALDEVRREVTTTMPGHHRTKAASSAASAGVDFAEALCDPSGEFPFSVVADQFGPAVGDGVRIGHGKPDGRLIVLGTGDVVERDGDQVSVEREMTPGGNYDALDIPREAGDVAHTKFREGRWWYPTVYRDDEGTPKGTYVNVCTPVEIFPDTVRYVDLHVDVIKHADGRVERVDDDELDEAVERGYLSEELAEKARSVAKSLEKALAQ